MSNAASEQARRDFERDQQARMREAHEFRTWQEQQAYNARIAHERAEAERNRNK